MRLWLFSPLPLSLSVFYHLCNVTFSRGIESPTLVPPELTLIVTCTSMQPLFGTTVSHPPPPRITLYRIQLISDLDEDSKVEGKDEYKAILKTGELVRTLKQQSEGRTISSNKVDSYEYSIKVNNTILVVSVPQLQFYSVSCPSDWCSIGLFGLLCFTPPLEPKFLCGHITKLHYLQFHIFLHSLSTLVTYQPLHTLCMVFSGQKMKL